MERREIRYGGERGMWVAGGPRGPQADPPPDACREKLVPWAALGWQDAREIW